jgi:hypothetical protein
MTMQQESVRDLSGLDARVHANSKSPRLGNRGRRRARPGPGGLALVCLPMAAPAPAYAGSWSSLPTPLTDWVYAGLYVFCYLS